VHQGISSEFLAPQYFRPDFHKQEINQLEQVSPVHNNSGLRKALPSARSAQSSERSAPNSVIGLWTPRT
jgi:hypothetical protein